MLLPLLGQQMFLGDLHLLLVGIAGKLNDLHTIQQGPGNGVQGIGGGDKEHLREVKGDLQEIVPERTVLLAVQSFQQRRRRVAPVVGGQLIDLIQHHQGVAASRLDNAADEPSGHGADVGAPVTPDFRLIVDAAQRNTHQLAVGGPGHTLRNAGLAGARGADKAEQPALDLRAQLLHRQVFADAFLHLFQAIVILVQDLSGLGNIHGFMGGFAPGDLQAHVQIAADHRRLRGAEGLLGKAAQLLVQPFPDLIAYGQRLDLRPVSLNVVILTQLGLDSLHFFPEIVFPLVAVDRLLGRVVQFFFNVQHVQLCV